IKHDGRGHAFIQKLKVHEAVVYLGEDLPFEADEVYLDTGSVQVIHERADEGFRIAVEKKRSVHQVDADDAQGILLKNVLRIKHPHVNHHFGNFRARSVLETHAHPTVGIVSALEVQRGHSV